MNFLLHLSNLRNNFDETHRYKIFITTNPKSATSFRPVRHPVTGTCIRNSGKENYPAVAMHMITKFVAKITSFNPLTPNSHYSGRIAPLTSRRCILNIYSTNTVLNILNMLHNLRFSLFNMPFIS
jgi:hypothetical protein